MSEILRGYCSSCFRYWQAPVLEMYYGKAINTPEPICPGCGHEMEVHQESVPAALSLTNRWHEVISPQGGEITRLDFSAFPPYPPEE